MLRLEVQGGFESPKNLPKVGKAAFLPQRRAAALGRVCPFCHGEENHLKKLSFKAKSPRRNQPWSFESVH